METQCRGVGGGRKRKNEKMGLGGGQTIKDSISKNRLRVAGGRGDRRVVGIWTLGRVCAMMSAVKCVNLAIHRPVPLG